MIKIFYVYFLCFLLGIVFGFSQDVPCAQILPEKYGDGMYKCPDVVSEFSAWAVFRCAMDQAKHFHIPSAENKESMYNLLKTFKRKKNVGPSRVLTTKILKHASELDLQVCRVRKDDINDSYLLFYTMPGISNYSGPFLLLRESNSSKVIIVSAHDDTDGTFADTKVGFQESMAFATISNGNNRRDVDGPNSDFVHNSTENLGTYTVEVMGQLWPKYVWLNIHGMKNNRQVLLRSRNQALERSFMDAISKYTDIDVFNILNADFSIDPLVKTNYYLKTEMPAEIHRTLKNVMANIVKFIETNDWAWL